MKTFASDLLGWYEAHHRPLPFRETRDPYRIWISEIMAQQTRMDTVTGYYHRFIQAFPQVLALAEATEEEVLKLWEGLGYYSRGRNLHKTAKIIVEAYRGRFPEDYDSLIKLPGIGDYTAGAILSIAFDQKVPAVDGNVQRVISRYDALDLDISDSRSKRVFKDRVLAKMDLRPGDFNQAVMELGALVCTPKNPACGDCPLRRDCKALAAGEVAGYPVKTRRVSVKKEKIALAYLEEGEAFLSVKGDAQGLLPGLWGFPYAVVEDFDTGLEALRDHLLTAYGFAAGDLQLKSEASHVFTHRKWEMRLYAVEGRFTRGKPEKEYQWVTLETLKTLPVSKAIQKLLGGI